MVKDIIKVRTHEFFNYGKRLKAELIEHTKESVFEVKYYTYGNTPHKSKLFFNRNKSRLEIYHEALESARNWLNNCKY